MHTANTVFDLRYLTLILILGLSLINDECNYNITTVYIKNIITNNTKISKK